MIMQPEPAQGGIRLPDRGATAALEGSSRTVMLEVLRHGPISRADLARRLDLSSASVTRVTKPLVVDGLLRERSAELRSNTGRPAVPLEVVADAAYFVGVKIVKDAVFSVVTDLAGTVVLERKAAVSDRAVESVLAVVVDEVEQLRRTRPRIDAVGVTVGGMVAEHRSVWGVTALGWGRVELADRLARSLQLPVTVENDVKAFTQAEHWFGTGRGLRSFAVITVGVGIGAAFVADDQLVIGDRGLAGLLDHWPLDSDGPACERGHRGCARVLLTAGAVERRAAVELGQTITFVDCMELATAGDPVATRIVAEAAYQLGRFTALVANLVGPQRILISGDGIAYALMAEDELRRGLADARHPLAPADDLVIERFEFFQWARGAAAMAIREYVLRDAGTAAASSGRNR